ncbi:5664_t:CDS:2, partial [Gigaspora margarita]
PANDGKYPCKLCPPGSLPIRNPKHGMGYTNLMNHLIAKHENFKLIYQRSIGNVTFTAIIVAPTKKIANDMNITLVGYDVRAYFYLLIEGFPNLENRLEKLQAFIVKQNVLQMAEEPMTMKG